MRYFIREIHRISYRMRTHTIHWRSKTSGRSGAGTRLLEKEEAERLATQLNKEYPGIYHEAVSALPVEHAPATVPARV
jgi:hypothetical protein